MADYKRVKKLAATEAAYIAGIIDGEGTITLSRRHRGDNRQLVVSVANTETNLLEYLCDTVGAGRITRKRTTSTEHTPSATWQIDNRQALTLLSQIAPFLQTYKAQRAALVLEKYVELTPRNGKYSQELTDQRNAFVKHFLNILPDKSCTSNQLGSG